QASEYFDQDAQEAGNMTSFIEITANGTTHRTSWVTRVEKTTLVSPLERLYDYSRILAQSVSDQ
ncbi:MAG TPA: hypothetical protein VKP65_15075, partial [Rhodothermales bacterium]|nr:hypothetical protein [Rhodothermales bacterium]